MASPQTPAVSISELIVGHTGDELLTKRQAAEILGYGVGWLDIERRAGRGPKCVRLSRKKILYLRSDLQEWARSRRQGGQS